MWTTQGGITKDGDNVAKFVLHYWGLTGGEACV